MATIEIEARLGNHLHKIATAYALSQKVGEDCIVRRWQWSSVFKNFYDYIITDNNPIFERTYIEQPYNKLTNPVEEIPALPMLKLVGAFESSQYFLGYETQVKNMFALPMIKNDYTVIHVRLTDFLHEHDHHIKLTNNYYRKAMSICPGPYIVVSDDIEMAKDRLKDCTDIVFIHNDVITDLQFMIGAKNLIIPNSTLSWWGAYLGRHEKVCCPKQWYRKSPDDSYKYEPSWIVIDEI